MTIGRCSSPFSASEPAVSRSHSSVMWAVGHTSPTHCRYLPGFLGRYQIILLGDRGTNRLCNIYRIWQGTDQTQSYKTHVVVIFKLALFSCDNNPTCAQKLGFHSVIFGCFWEEPVWYRNWLYKTEKIAFAIKASGKKLWACLPGMLTQLIGEDECQGTANKSVRACSILTHSVKANRLTYS